MDKMKVYFSHPTITYRTRTESTCMEIIDESLGPAEIVNPSNYGLKDDLKPIIHESDAVVGMAVENKYTFLVWNEMSEGKSQGAEIYTIRVKNKEKIGRVEKGMPREVEKLAQEESKKFTNRLLKENRESLISAIFGNWGSRF